MKCPFCGDQESKVVDSRHSEDNNSIRRRRECMACQRRFTTGMVRAFDKRKVEMAELERIATEIEQSIQNTLEREVTSDKIGEMVMARIKSIDEVAYIRFASVYRQFQDVGSFVHEINQFLEEK